MLPPFSGESGIASHTCPPGRGSESQHMTAPAPWQTPITSTVKSLDPSPALRLLTFPPSWDPQPPQPGPLLSHRPVPPSPHVSLLWHVCGCVAHETLSSTKSGLRPSWSRTPSSAGAGRTGNLHYCRVVMPSQTLCSNQLVESSQLQEGSTTVCMLQRRTRVLWSCSSFPRTEASGCLGHRLQTRLSLTRKLRPQSPGLWVPWNPSPGRSLRVLHAPRPGAPLDSQWCPALPSSAHLLPRQVLSYDLTPTCRQVQISLQSPAAHQHDVSIPHCSDSMCPNRSHLLANPKPAPSLGFIRWWPLCPSQGPTRELQKSTSGLPFPSAVQNDVCKHTGSEEHNSSHKCNKNTTGITLPKEV